jgi:hypothetical protein
VETGVAALSGRTEYSHILLSINEPDIWLETAERHLLPRNSAPLSRLHVTPAIARPAWTGQRRPCVRSTIVEDHRRHSSRRAARPLRPRAHRGPPCGVVCCVGARALIGQWRGVSSPADMHPSRRRDVLRNPRTRSYLSHSPSAARPPHLAVPACWPCLTCPALSPQPTPIGWSGSSYLDLHTHKRHFPTSFFRTSHRLPSLPPSHLISCRKTSIASAQSFQLPFLNRECAANPPIRLLPLSILRPPSASVPLTYVIEMSGQVQEGDKGTRRSLSCICEAITSLTSYCGMEIIRNGFKRCRLFSYSFPRP